MNPIVILLSIALAYSADACSKQAVKPFIPDANRIVGGIVATAHSWPWMISLKEYGFHMCGGSLINNNYIISAAHCFEGASARASNWQAVLGSHRQSRTEASQQNIGISRIIVHPKYNSFTSKHDIALLKLSRPVAFSNEIQPVCLPDANDASVEWKTGLDLKCTATGWGNTKGTGSNDPLRQVTVPMIARQTCAESAYYGSQFDYRGKSMVCAGYRDGGKDSCQGDSGGPLVCKKNNVWKLAGVTSWGYGCAMRYKPGVYANVAKYIDWIAANSRY
ncbi:trypsin-like [Lineus longissimus]|uniref:trypsin-like n=1 Tax=Lineus longissimus TaxID=88925 RepID=UPI002B4EE2CB